MTMRCRLSQGAMADHRGGVGGAALTKRVAIFNQRYLEIKPDAQILADQVHVQILPVPSAV
jgi:hypothetical protein